MPPLAPGMGIVCTRRPTWRARLTRQRWPLPPLLQRPSSATLTMRTSLLPRPAETVQRKRPSGVSAPPAGRLPRPVSLPYGLSSRPLGWIGLAGPMRPSSGAVAATAMPAATTADTAMRAPTRIRKGADSSGLAGPAAPVPHRDAVVVARDGARARRAGCTAVLVEVRPLTDGAAGTREQRPHDPEEHHDEEPGEDAAASCQCDYGHTGQARPDRHHPV